MDQVDVRHLKCVSVVCSSSQQEMSHCAVDIPAVTLLTPLDKVPHTATKWECYLALRVVHCNHVYSNKGLKTEN